MPGNLQNISLKFRMGLWEMYMDLDNTVRTDLLLDNVSTEPETRSEIELCFIPRPAVVLFQCGDQSIPLLRAWCSLTFITSTLTMYQSCSPAVDNGSPVLRWTKLLGVLFESFARRCRATFPTGLVIATIKIIIHKTTCPFLGQLQKERWRMLQMIESVACDNTYAVRSVERCVWAQRASQVLRLTCAQSK